MLVRLFLAGEELPESLVPPALLEGEGIVRRSGGRVRALVRLDPVRGLVIASDPRPADGTLRADHVVRPGPASETLAALTVRRPVESALDLGTGSGVQALLAAAHARRVVGTDVNPRALELAALSAELNGVANVEWRRGDLFEPVGEERFDLVVSNPPFVVSPARELTFRDGGRRGDELSRDVVRGAAARLRDGGFAHVLCGWVVGADEHWSDAPRRWLDGRDCDAVLLRIDTEDTVSYAIRWSSLDAAVPPDVTEWLDYYRALGIEQIATGVVTLRRRAGASWVHADELVSLRGDAGPQLERIVAGNDLLAALPDDRALASLPLRLAPGVSLVQRLRDGAVERARLSADAGVALPARVPPELVAGLLEPGLRTDATLPVLRDLVRRGYLVVAEDGRS